MYHYINNMLDKLDQWAEFPTNYYERPHYKIGEYASLIMGIIKFNKEDDYKLISFTDIVFSMATNPHFLSEIYHISITVIPAKIIEQNAAREFICQWMDIKENKNIVYYDKYSILKANEDYSLAYWEYDEKRSLPLAPLGNNIFDNIGSKDAKFYNLEFALSILFGSPALYEFFIAAIMHSFSLFKCDEDEIAQLQGRLKMLCQKVKQFQQRKLN